MDEKIKALFPLKGEITQEIIDTADINSIYNCIGAKTLVEVIKNKVDLSQSISKPHWGRNIGFFYVKEQNCNVTTEERIDFMKITKPQSVTFILINNYL